MRVRRRFGEKRRGASRILLPVALLPSPRPSLSGGRILPSDYVSGIGQGVKVGLGRVTRFRRLGFGWG